MRTRSRTAKRAAATALLLGLTLPAGGCLWWAHERHEERAERREDRRDERWDRRGERHDDRHDRRDERRERWD